MRVSECAEFTGTTVRTIRYYHQIGLLPVPGTWAGRRDYDLEHVARLLRIRWLSDAGMSLEQIRAVLNDGVTPLGELRQTAAQLDERIRALQEQRERVTALIDVARCGRGFRALPPGTDAFYRRMAELTDDPDTLATLRRDERTAELLAQRGMLTPGFDDVIASINDDDMAAIADFYRRFGKLEQHPADLEPLARDLVEWAEPRDSLARRLVSAMPGWARAPITLRMSTAVIRLMGWSATQRAFVNHTLAFFGELLTASTPRTEANS